MYQIKDETIINNFNNGKFLKKDMRKITKEMYKAFNLNTRGYKEIDIMGKLNNDGSIVIYHIGQWKEEKEANTFDYDLSIFNKDGVLVYDEGDGELNINKIRQYYDYIDCFEVKDGIIDDIRRKLFYPFY